ncbi:MAG: ASCH domain-containing protein [Desulfovibrio sp.]
MKAISIYQPWASLIALGEKTIEARSWETSHRGDLLICSSAKSCLLEDGATAPGGYALAVVELVDVRPFTREDLEAACLEVMPSPAGFAWVLANAREIEPFAVKGRQRIFNVDPPFLRPLPGASETFTHIEFISQARQQQPRVCAG